MASPMQQQRHNMLIQENAELRQALHQMTEKYNKFLQGARVKIDGLKGDKVGYLDRANKLKGSILKLRDIQGKDVGQLRQIVGALEEERKQIHAKVKGKLEELVLEKYELRMRLRELERNHVDPAELQALRRQVTILLNEKGTLMQRHGEQKAALQNAAMWNAQNQQLRAQLATMATDAQETMAKVNQIQSGIQAKEEEKNRLNRTLAELTEQRRLLQIRLSEEKVSHRNSALWVKQNEQLRNRIVRLKNENRVLAAKVADMDNGEDTASAEIVELEAQVTQNEGVRNDLAAAVGGAEGEVEEAKGQVPVIEAEIQTLTAENTALGIQVRKLQRRSEAITTGNEEFRLKMRAVGEEKSSLLLGIEELMAEVKKVAEWERQNDELRWNLQELLDENSQLSRRMRQLESGADSGLESDGTSDGASRMDDLFGGAGGSGGGGSGGGPALSRPGPVAMDADSIDANPRGSFHLGNLVNQILQHNEADDAGGDEEGIRERAESMHQNTRVTQGTTLVFEEDDLKSGASRMQPRIKLATLEKLVERLTFEEYPDMEFVEAFMLTYRSFTSPLELMELIVARYCITPPGGLSKDELLEYKTKRQTPIRLRAFNVLKTWITDHFYDFEDDPELIAMMREFVETTMPATGMPRPAQRLQRMLDRVTEEKRDEDMMLQSRMPSVMPNAKKLKNMTFSNCDNRLLALAISVAEQDLYCRIHPKECFGLAWSKKNKAEKSPNILEIVGRFNDMSRWTQYEILTCAGPGSHKQRAACIKKMVRLAKALVDVNNFNGCMEIISGLQASGIYRLKHAWGRVDNRTKALFDELKELLSAHKNYSKLRSRIRGCAPPVVPYLGIFLTDMTFIEDGNPNHIDGLINFKKRRLYADVLVQIMNYQQVRYTEPVDATVVAFLDDRLAMSETELPDEDVAYNLSLEVEPRGQ